MVCGLWRRRGGSLGDFAGCVGWRRALVYVTRSQMGEEVVVEAGAGEARLPFLGPKSRNRDKDRLGVNIKLSPPPRPSATRPLNLPWQLAQLVRTYPVPAHRGVGSGYGSLIHLA